MKKWKVSVPFELWLDVTIEAESHDEAVTKVDVAAQCMSVRQVADWVHAGGGFFEMTDMTNVQETEEDADFDLLIRDYTT